MANHNPWWLNYVTFGVWDYYEGPIMGHHNFKPGGPTWMQHFAHHWGRAGWNVLKKIPGLGIGTHQTYNSLLEPGVINILNGGTIHEGLGHGS